MKTSKPRVQKKAAKKIVRKQFEKSLSDKIFETVKHVGQDAERIGDEIAMISKSLTVFAAALYLLAQLGYPTALLAAIVALISCLSRAA